MDDPKTVDCVIVGFNDSDLQTIMASREKMAGASGAYRHMLGSTFRHRGQWLHHVNFLNAVLQESTGREYRLHTMDLPNLAVCYLTSFLTRQGLNVEMVNFYNTGRERLAELLRAGSRTVAITTTLYVESEPVVEIARFVREHGPQARIIVGGPHILNLCSLPNPAVQDVLLQGMDADIFVHDAQGETTLAALLFELRKGDAADLANVPNLIYRPGAAKGPQPPAPRQAGVSPYVRTERREEHNDMQCYAIDWDRRPRELYVPTASMIMSRSCPFRCSFCRYPSIAGPWRTAGVDVVERQLRQLREAGTRTVIFFDDTPNVPLPRFKEMLRMMIRERFEMSWFSNLRCSNADVEAYDLMAASGCKGVFLGIESGDQTILNNMNKKATVEQYREGIRELTARGIVTYASFIVGFPGETPETVRRTIEFIEETRPTYYQVHEYFHSKNVPIQQQAAQFGLRGSDYSWRHDTMDWQASCDAVDTMRRTIRGSIVGTSYLSTFWMLAYLYGLGATLEHIRAFMMHSRDALLAGIGPGGVLAAQETPLSPELLGAARSIAADLDSAARSRETAR